jgi:putative oxidoreductase
MPASGPPVSASLVDPEDDLPSASYAGDFEITTIPHYSSSGISAGSANAGGPGFGYGLAGGQQPVEPLPYVHPQFGGGHVAFGHAEFDPGEDDERLRAAGRRGTQNLGLLVLRVGLGVVLFAHGLQKLFGWWAGQGLNGFEDRLSATGYQHADILPYFAAGGEIAAGLLLVLGLWTPIAAAGVLAYLINGLLAGISAQRGLRSFPFFLPDGHEYEITLVVICVAIILAGPGRYGLDAGRGWARRPFIGSFAALLLGIGSGVAVWVMLNGATPVV